MKALSVSWNSIRSKCNTISNVKINFHIERFYWFLYIWEAVWNTRIVLYWCLCHFNLQMPYFMIKMFRVMSLVFCLYYDLVPILMRFTIWHYDKLDCNVTYHDVALIVLQSKPCTCALQNTFFKQKHLSEVFCKEFRIRIRI